MQYMADAREMAEHIETSVYAQTLYTVFAQPANTAPLFLQNLEQVSAYAERILGVRVFCNTDE